MAAQHRTPAYCPHGDRLSRLHRGCDWEAAAIVATRLATRARWEFRESREGEIDEASAENGLALGLPHRWLMELAVRYKVSLLGGWRRALGRLARVKGADGLLARGTLGALDLREEPVVLRLHLVEPRLDR